MNFHIALATVLVLNSTTAFATAPTPIKAPTQLLTHVTKFKQITWMMFMANLGV